VRIETAGKKLKINLFKFKFICGKQKDNV